MTEKTERVIVISVCVVMVLVALSTMPLDIKEAKGGFDVIALCRIATALERIAAKMESSETWIVERKKEVVGTIETEISEEGEAR